MEEAAASAAKRGQVRRRLPERQAFVDEMLQTLRADVSAVTESGMAQALGMSPRTLNRWRNRLNLAWPPIDRKDWEQLAREAAAQPPPTDSWLITCRVTAATLGDAEAKLRPDSGIVILEARRLESVSIVASRWRPARSDTA